MSTEPGASLEASAPTEPQEPVKNWRCSHCDMAWYGAPGCPNGCDGAAPVEPQEPKETALNGEKRAEGFSRVELVTTVAVSLTPERYNELLRAERDLLDEKWQSQALQFLVEDLVRCPLDHPVRATLLDYAKLVIPDPARPWEHPWVTTDTRAVERHAKGAREVAEADLRALTGPSEPIERERPEGWLQRSLDEAAQNVAALPQWTRDLDAARTSSTPSSVVPVEHPTDVLDEMREDLGRANALHEEVRTLLAEDAVEHPIEERERIEDRILAAINNADDDDAAVEAVRRLCMTSLRAALPIREGERALGVSDALTTLMHAGLATDEIRDTLLARLAALRTDPLKEPNG